MRVCFVSHTAGMAGAERSLLDTIRVLGGHGVTATVLLPRHGPLERALDRLGVKHHMLPYRWWRGSEDGPAARRLARVLWNAAMVPPAAALIRRSGADLVYSNTVSVGIGAFAAAVAGRPHAWHIRELPYDLNRITFDLGERATLAVIDRYSDVCLANSWFVAGRFRAALAPDKLHVVYQGVRVNGATPVEPDGLGDGFRCAVVGSIGPRKRQKEAVLAVARLVREGIPARLWIIGRGDERYQAELERLVVAERLTERVRFLGEVESAPGLMRRADVIVVCAGHEPFGRVTVEGMLVGKPVVGARSGGTAELIQDGFNGLLYPLGDPAALAARLRWLYEHPEAGRRVGDQGRRWAAGRFTPARYGREVFELLRPLARGAG